MEESSRFLCILAALNNYNRTIKILEKIPYSLFKFRSREDWKYAPVCCAIGAEGSLPTKRDG